MKTATIVGIAAAALSLTDATAAPLKSAVVTTIVNDVKVSEKRAAAQPISTGVKMTGASTMLTGTASRAEMTFPDNTVTRVGANSIFRFSSGSRDMEIDQGSFLLQVPKNAGGATIRTATVTAGITGTTTMMEYNPGKYIKFICLEGTAKLTNRKGDKVAVPAGHLLVMHPDAATFPRLAIINVAKMMKTSALTNKKTFGKLQPAAEMAINETVAQQKKEESDGNLTPAGFLQRGPQGEDGHPRSLFGEISGRLWNRHESTYPYPYPNRPYTKN